MQILIPKEKIAERVAELGRTVSEWYRDRPLTVIGVLHGSVVLVADLIREIATPHQIAFVRASSYRGETTTGADLTISLDLLPDVTGRDVLLVDDICDTGRTLSALSRAVMDKGAKSLRTAVLLWKPDRSATPMVPDLYAFNIPDVFVVGYGLDYNGNYRHLRDIAVLDEGER